MGLYVKSGGTWVLANPFVKSGGVWSRAKMYTRVGGAWVPNDIITTDFREYTAGAAPVDWTARYTTTGWTTVVQTVAGSLSGKALRITKTAAQDNLLSWNSVPSIADVEVLMRWRAIEAWADADNIVHACMRASGATGSETNYKVAVMGRTTGTLYQSFFNKAVAGTSTSFTAANGPTPNLATNAWIWLRARVNGTTLYRKMWHDGVAEPGTWDATLTDSSVSAAGWCGISSYGANPNAEVDFYGVGLNGKTVPVPS
ncbi:MAG: hypothetical protein E5V40_08595 [Mesorhizobium sp.]|nr:MAG: hypothetical protein E5V40_08595 [Mesorhizobium sp.]